MGQETKKLTATLPVESVRWLRETYPDHTSDSARVAAAIGDARKLDGLISARRLVEVVKRPVEGDQERERGEV